MTCSDRRSTFTAADLLKGTEVAPLRDADRRRHAPVPEARTRRRRSRAWVKTPIRLTAEVSDDDQPVRAEVRAGPRRPSLPNGTIITGRMWWRIRADRAT